MAYLRNRKGRRARAPETDCDRGRALVQWYFDERPSVSGSPAGQLLKGSDFQRTNNYGSMPASSGRCGGSVLRAINDLTSVHQNWVHYCYNPSQRKKREVCANYQRMLAAMYSDSEALTRARSTTRAVVRLMIRLQVYQARSYHEFCKWSQVQPVEMRGGISADAWKKTYANHWRRIRTLMVAIDNDAMRLVYERAGRAG